ncbi:MAG: DNA repair exonuclease [Planctomycetes bacterium]|nr:DNA repair exonuclease [Planctomycetota bacterium]
MIRFIHAADIHLDSPLKGLEQYPGAPVEEVRGATRRALENLVELALDRNVDFVLIAGDLYDGDWKDHNTGLFFVEQMNRLREADVAVVMISGNHDAANKMTKSLRLPENVELLSHTRPATAKSKTLDRAGVAIHGQSFRRPAEFDNLACSYPQKHSGMFNIGLLHTSLDGAAGHESYAPCTLDHLQQKEYEYWALGHVHTRQTGCEDPPIVFPGNIQGRHIREPGAKGCYVVTADERGRCEREFVPLDVFRWETCTLDATEAKRPDCVLDRFSSALDGLTQHHDGLPLAVRVEVTGVTEAYASLLADPVGWTNEVRAAALAAPNGRVWIEKVQWRMAPRRELLDAADHSSPIGTLLGYLQELRDDGPRLHELDQVLDDLERKLPDELRRGDDALGFRDPDQMRRWLDEVEPLLLNRLRERVSA